MIAQVINLPSVAANNAQSRPSGITEDVSNTQLQNVQIDSAQAKKETEQASQNIEEVRRAAQDLNVFAEKIQTNLNFSVDEGSGRSVITVTDSQTGDVIRQIPAKEVLAVANIIRETSAANIDKVGLLLAEQG
ncbi:MAG: flagellar protein FlaG [Gammaproteobacteria bacterium]